MVINRETKQISHHKFFDLPQLLTTNDVLVFNRTKVFPAKLKGKKETGGNVELLLLEKIQPLIWKTLGKGNIRVGQKLNFDNAMAEVITKDQGQYTVKFDKQPLGLVPLPPYIKSMLTQQQLADRYQTVYAQEAGSVAAPTAGLHFTTDLINSLEKLGVKIEYVTLHVGPGTFMPIKTNDLSKHKMHSERFHVDKDVINRLNAYKKSGKRIISVGTTTTRVLETLANENSVLENNFEGKTDIFIVPPYKFKFIDGLVTNFHLPHSTLLALVSAFVSNPNTNDKFDTFSTNLIGKAYREAIKNDYRFYSFGDASLII